MDIFIDDGEGDDWFFISIPLNKNEDISFDYTQKGFRMTKQCLVERREMGLDIAPTMEWNTLHIKNGRLAGKEHIRWVDQGRYDWVNNEVWETVWERPISHELKDALLEYSITIRKNIDHLDRYKKEIKEFEGIIKKSIEAI